MSKIPMGADFLYLAEAFHYNRKGFKDGGAYRSPF
jgi:hypothetical protein